MPRYQLGEQLWSIERVDGRITIEEPDGTTRVEEPVTLELAKTRVTVLLNQKRREGWKLVIETESETKHVENFSKHARDLELEASILAAPEDLDAWRVYGDWLQQQGDPRGTHIALRAGMHAAPGDPVAAERMRKFEAQHYAYLHGHDVLPEGAGSHKKLGWGFVDHIHGAHPDSLGAVLATHACAFVRGISVSSLSAEDAVRVFEVLGRVVPPTLRELSCWGITGPIRTLEPLAGVLPQLRVLDLECDLWACCLAILAATPMPALEEFTLRHTDRGSAAELAALLQHSRLDRLVSFELRDQVGASIGKLLGKAPFAAGLELLTLHHFDRALAEAMIAHFEADRFPKLVTLRVKTSHLDPRLAKRLDEHVHVTEP